MRNIRQLLASLLVVGALSVASVAADAGATRYDSQIQQQVTQQLQAKHEFSRVQSSVEDGIVTLTGTVDVYRQKLDATKRARKVHNAQGVRNLIDISSTVPDQDLQRKLAEKLEYDRVGYYDNAFNYLTVGVKNGVVTVGGETYNDVGRDSALATVASMPGVKDVVDEVKIAPVSIFDDNIRLGTARAIYRDDVLGRYAIDPADPIRIIVNNGNVTLYGTVESAMDKQIAGIRASSVPGAFSVQNNLTVEGQAGSGM